MLERYLPSELLGAMNGAVFALMLFLCSFLVVYIWKNLRCAHWSYRAAYNDIAIAVPLLLLATGEGVVRVVIWFGRFAVAQQWNADPYRGLMMSLILFGIVLIFLGALCLMRVLVETRWPNWVWVSLGLFSLAFGLGSMY